MKRYLTKVDGRGFEKKALLYKCLVQLLSTIHPYSLQEYKHIS